MSTDLSEKIEKLPAWARLEIKRLQGVVKERDETIAAMKLVSNPDATGIIAARFGLNVDTINERINLPDRSVIEFGLANGRKICATFSSRSERDGIEVYSVRDGIRIAPCASNSIYVS